MRRLAVLACAGLSGFTLSACGIGEQSKSALTEPKGPPLAASGKAVTAPPGQGPSVSLQNIKFAPASIHALVGQTIRWRNADAVPHTVVARSGAGFRSHVLDPGGTFSFKPTKTGTIRYVCTLHPNMRGTVVVGR